jgi:hypothetical protein
MSQSTPFSPLDRSQPSPLGTESNFYPAGGKREEKTKWKDPPCELSWVNSLFLWSFSSSRTVSHYQRVVVDYISHSYPHEYPIHLHFLRLNPTNLTHGTCQEPNVRYQKRRNVGRGLWPPKNPKFAPGEFDPWQPNRRSEKRWVFTQHPIPVEKHHHCIVPKMCSYPLHPPWFTIW